MSSKKIVINPYFNEFIYDVVYNSTREDRERLDRRYWRPCSGPKSLRRFITQASMDEKCEMLVQLGIQWAVIFFEQDYPSKKYLREIFTQYDAGKGSQPSLLSTIIKNRMFITGDKQMAANLGAMGRLQNHSVYSQSLLLNKVGFHPRKWKKEVDDTDTKQAKENLKIANEMATSFSNAIDAYEYSADLFGLLKNDIRILLYLYSRKSRYTDYDTILGRFIGSLNKTKITAVLRRLLTGQLISKSPKLSEYLITSTGILTINTFFKAVIKSNEIQ